MPTMTYSPLATVTLGSSASSVTFSNIPATYRDLIFVFNGQLTGVAGISFRINADSGSNYSTVYMRNVASTPDSASFVDTRIFTSLSSITSGTRVFAQTQIMDYSATDKHKTVLTRSGYDISGSGTTTEAHAARWANTTAITSLAFTTSANQFAAGSTFNLYGVIA
jgi:hypothetical protein